jgi:DNA-damage-inducible protein J
MRHISSRYREFAMAAHTSMLHVRIDEALKTEAAAKLAGFGLTVSDAVRILLTRVVKDGALPAALTADPEAYDAWFKNKVAEALAESAPAIPHDLMMEEATAFVAGKNGPARERHTTRVEMESAGRAAAKT